MTTDDQIDEVQESLALQFEDEIASFRLMHEEKNNKAIWLHNRVNFACEMEANDEVIAQMHQDDELDLRAAEAGQTVNEYVRDWARSVIERLASKFNGMSEAELETFVLIYTGRTHEDFVRELSVPF